MPSSLSSGPRSLLLRLGPHMHHAGHTGPLSLAAAAARPAAPWASTAFRRSSTTSSTLACATARMHGLPSSARCYLVLRRGSSLATVCSLLALALQQHEQGPSACAAAAGSGSGSDKRRRGAAGAEEEEGDDAETALRKALDAALGPLGGEISFGAIVGFTSGYALKKVGKTVAVVIGMTYLCAQTLSSLGYVDVNWKKLERQVMGLLGQKEGDSYKLSQRDLEYYWGKLKEALEYQLPSTGGFAAGFAVGLYKG